MQPTHAKPILVTVQDRTTGKYYRARVSQAVAEKHNNYALVSVGWTVDEDLPRASFARMDKEEITQEQFNHSGCQSRCILRGNDKCQW
jgi:hypothetical protein